MFLSRLCLCLSTRRVEASKMLLHGAGANTGSGAGALLSKLTLRLEGCRSCKRVLFGLLSWWTLVLGCKILLKTGLRDAILPLVRSNSVAKALLYGGRLVSLAYRTATQHMHCRWLVSGPRQAIVAALLD